MVASIIASGAGASAGQAARRGCQHARRKPCTCWLNTSAICFSESGSGPLLAGRDGEGGGEAVDDVLDAAGVGGGSLSPGVGPGSAAVGPDATLVAVGRAAWRSPADPPQATT